MPRVIFSTRRRARLSSQKSPFILAVFMAALVSLALATAPVSAAPDSKGTDFWLAFPSNLGGPELTLFIAGDTTTSGTVEIPSLSFSTPFSVTPGSVTTVALPSGAVLTASDGVEDLGIHVTSTDEVTVYGLNRVQFTTDAHLGLPTDILGTDYIVLGWKNVQIVNNSEAAVVATQDGTTVTITPSVSTGTHTAGTPFTVALNKGQTYQLMAAETDADLTGTIVSSDKPIAVYGGHQCANIPNGSTVACDHVEEELPPTSTWGKSFVTEPLATRLNGDTFRILASADNTAVSIDGTVVATLNRGQIHEQIITAASVITADKPVLVAQYSNGSSFDGVTSDPFMMLIPPYEQFLASYTVTTPATGFATNFINVVAPTAAVGQVTLDGTAIPAASFTAIGSSGFSGAQLPIELGSHTLNGPLPFGAFVYGYDSYDSYGYPGGLSLAPVAQVTSVVLSPKTATNTVNTQHCVNATVTDQNGGALVGVRVDFAVTGVNPTAGFAATDGTGVAQFCYTGANTGDDTITGTVGTVSDTASKTWSTAEKTDTKTAYTGGSTVQYSDAASLSANLTTAGGTPIAGKQIGFTLGSQTTSGSPTNAAGDVSAAPLKVLQAPGSVSNVTAAFAGDADYNSSSDTKPFSISKEDCTLVYAGDVALELPGTVSLEADLGELDTSLGDLSGKSLVFTLTDASNATQTFTATTDASGHASTSQALAAGVYTVQVAFAGDGYYASCSAEPVVLTVTEAPAASKIKTFGAGSFKLDDTRISFGFAATTRRGVHGQLELQITCRRAFGNHNHCGRSERKGAPLCRHRFRSKLVQTLTGSGKTATLTGVGRWDGSSGYTFVATVTDGGKGQPDTFEITIKDPTDHIAFSTEGPVTPRGQIIVRIS